MEDASVIELLLRLFVSLGVVLGLMVLIGRVMKRKMMPGAVRGSKGGGRVAAVEVLARQGLSRTASVAVVRAGGKTLVLGVTDAAVNVLTEMEPDDGAVDEPVEGNDRPTGLGAARTLLFGGGEPGLTPGDPVTSPSWREMVERLRERTVRRS